jgi:hypothetical protein
MIDFAISLPLTATIVGLTITAYKAIPQRSNARCIAHAAIETRLTEGDKRMDTICKDVTVTKNLVIAIAASQGITVTDLKSEIQDVMGAHQ